MKVEFDTDEFIRVLDDVRLRSGERIWTGEYDHKRYVVDTLLLAQAYYDQWASQHNVQPTQDQSYTCVYLGLAAASLWGLKFVVPWDVDIAEEWSLVKKYILDNLAMTDWHRNAKEHSGTLAGLIEQMEISEDI